MALIDKLFDLEDTSVFKKNYQKVGGTNTELGEFQVKQGDNTGRDSKLTEKKSDLQLKEEPPRSLPPEIKGRQQALEAVGDVGFGKTALFVGKQTALHTLNPSINTRAYNPASLVKNLAVSSKNFVDTGDLPLGVGDLFGPLGYGKNPVDAVKQVDIKKSGTTFLGINKFNGEDNRPSKRLQIQINEEPISYGLKGELEIVDNDNDTKGLPDDFIKFHIKDVVSNKMIQFPAYLADITDNSSAEYSPTRYIGRADQVYVYSGYTRNIGFGFRVAALSRGDIHMMWKKIDHLKRLALPQYSTEVFDDNEPRMKAPYVELTIGDLYKKQLGFFSGINVTIPQTSNWETKDGHQLTHLCDVSLEFTYIGRQVPSLDTKQYDYYDFPEKPTQKEIKDKQLTGTVEVGELQVADAATTLRSNFIYGTDGEILNVAKDPLT